MREGSEDSVGSEGVGKGASVDVGWRDLGSREARGDERGREWCSVGG